MCTGLWICAGLDCRTHKTAAAVIVTLHSRPHTLTHTNKSNKQARSSLRRCRCWWRPRPWRCWPPPGSCTRTIHNVIRFVSRITCIDAPTPPAHPHIHKQKKTSGHALSRAFSPLHSTPTHALAALLSLALAFTQQPRLAAPSVLTALLTLALLIARVLMYVLYIYIYILTAAAGARERWALTQTIHPPTHPHTCTPQPTQHLRLHPPAAAAAKRPTKRARLPLVARRPAGHSGNHHVQGDGRPGRGYEGRAVTCRAGGGGPLVAGQRRGGAGLGAAGGDGQG